MGNSIASCSAGTYSAMIHYSGNKELQSHALLNILILSLMPNIFPGMKLIKDRKVKSEA
jgi:hypothetical protein